MVSKMAMEDIRSIEEDTGCHVAPEDVVRLNVFGLKTDFRDNNVLARLQRVAFIGEGGENEIVIREPTVGHDLWIQTISQFLDLDDIDTYLQTRCYSLSRNQNELPDPFNRELVMDEIRKFTKEKLSNFTRAQIWYPLMYAVDGCSPDVGERVPFTKGKNEERQDAEDCRYVVGLISNGTILKIGTQQEMRDMTPSLLNALIEYRRTIDYHEAHSRRTNNEHLGEYFKVLQEIKDKYSKAEKQSVKENG